MSDSMAGSRAAADEVARFDALAAQWWDPRGPMRPLHAMNPVRIGWIDARIRAHFAALSPGPVRLLDIGCGAGLAAEALAKRGHDVLGMDAAGEVIGAAIAHGAGQELKLAYRTGLADDLSAEGARFQVITALEVIEHVPDPAGFVASLAGLLEPGGLLFLSTLNRTRRSWLTAILGAEYVLRLLPTGTHDWSKFLTPAEVAGLLRQAGLRPADIAGMNLWPAGWRAGGSTAVNYIVMAEAPGATQGGA
jgi:2-polyprenyl-6-hydroxyphenyl methylase/3-demethylubiquinone-9 3-methyltransferase